MKNNKRILLALLSFISIVGVAQNNLNAGGFCFGIEQKIDSNHIYSKVISTDFDGDGDNDLVAYDSTVNKLKVYINDGIGNFINPIVQPIYNVADITVGNLVGADSKPDIAVLQLNGDIFLYKNTSTTLVASMTITANTFAPPVGTNSVTIAATIDAVDYNFDNNVDLFVSYYNQFLIQPIVYKYLGYTNNAVAGTFTLQPNTGTVGFIASNMSDCKVALADLNKDNLTDAVFTSYQPIGMSALVIYSVGGNLFSGSINSLTLTSTNIFVPLTDMKIEDYNADGNLDVGIYAKGKGFSVFKGNGLPTLVFTEQFIINPASQGETYLWKDMDGDGINDFLSSYKSRVKIYINKGQTYPNFVLTQDSISPILGSTPSSFIIDQFDKNSLQDIVVSGDYGSSGNLRLIKNYSYPYPQASTVSNNGGIVCSGSPVTLSVKTTSLITNPSYVWSPTNQTTPAITTTSATTHYATITYTPEAGATCSITSVPYMVTYTTGTLPIFTITPQANPFCMKVPTETKLSFNVTGVTNYTLLANPVPITNGTSIYPGLGINTYTIDGEAVSGGCINTQTFSVVGLQAPISHPISSSNMTTTLCAGSPLILTAHCDSTKNYLWMPGSFTNSVITVNPTSSTTYTMIASNGICTDTAMFSVNVSPVPIINASISATNICTNQGGAVVVNYFGTPGNNYVTTWGSNSYTTSSFTLNPTTTTIYSIKATNSSYTACPTTDSIFTINVNTTPTVNVSPLTATVCANESITLTANSTANSYTWSTGSNTNTIVVTPSINSTYTVSGADVSGTCKDTKTITIYAKSLPIITASTNSTQICSGGLAVLQAGGGTTYSWSPVGIFGINPSISVFPTVNTTYTVYGKGLNGCVNFTTVSVGVYSALNINAYATPSTICVGETATLSVTGGTPTVGNYQNEIVSPTINTSYSVIIKDNNGCFYNRVAYVEVNAICATFIYNGFTPNGDGVNEFFYIDHIERFTNNKVFIYNRWGNIVFETTNYNNLTNAWDGRVKGTVVPNGTYFYVINLNDGSEPKKGWLEITGQ